MNINEFSPIFLELLRLRGIGEDDVEEFLSSSPKLTYDPFLMKNMREGVKHLISYISEGRRICIYGDYDADGITSVSIMMQAISRFTDNVFYYIPSRFDEGYGLNIDAVDIIIDKGAELILTVDCGSVSYNEVLYAKSKGIDVIVTDHHSIDDVKADCILINPKQDDCPYPFKGLAGCAVAFKFVCAMQRELDADRSMITDALDLVAIGTIGDVVPLVDENRTLVKYGLRKIRQMKRKGLVHLLREIGIDQLSVTEESLAYHVVPILNAAGRIKNADIAVDVLLSDDDSEIAEGVTELILRNRSRRKLQDDAYAKCVEIVESDLNDRNFIMVKCEDAHEGIAGIVAGKLKDKYKRPVAVLTPTGDKLKGTGRSISTIDLFEIMKQFQENFDKFGGHKGACGFTMDESFLDNVSDGLNAAVTDMINENPDILTREITADMRLSLSDISDRVINEIEMLSPFGQNNRRPVFAINVSRISDVKYMGNESQHVRFTAYDVNEKKVKCVLFSKADEYRQVIDAGLVNEVMGTLEKQVWKNMTAIQLVINEIR